jgi:Protein of unknown function (DUF2950)
MMRLLHRACIIILLGVAAASSANAAQRTFATPEEAVEALVAALAAADANAVLEIFGPEHEEFLTGGDRAAAREEWRRVYDAAKEVVAIRPVGESSAIVVLGRKAWPMPIPLVKSGDAWRFDTEAGIEEVTNRRIGRNELSAINVGRAYIDAQVEYASRDRDHDGVREYAQHLVSTNGKHDGLYWPAEPGAEASPLGSLAVAEFTKGRKPGDPYLGYYFRILTRQGSNAPGGAYDYIINGHMIAGFALVAWPAEYGVSGIMTFLASSHGDVLQKDLGEETEQTVESLDAYDPDDTWDDAED